jgi:sugar-specific transcriptional regulator TrmB
MDNKVLLDIGLTEGESKVYTTLLKLGETKTGLLAKESGVSSSKVYKILDRLAKKGLVGFIVKGKIKYFVAISPKRLLEYFDEQESNFASKRKTLEEMVSILEIKKGYNPTVGIVYEGFNAVTNIFRNILHDLKSGEKYYTIGAGYGEGGDKLKSFFKLYHKKRAARGIIVNMLANHDERETISLNIDPKSKVKYLPKYLLTNMQILFYKNKSFIILWTKDMIAISIENNAATNSFKTYFDTFWEIAKE